MGEGYRVNTSANELQPAMMPFAATTSIVNRRNRAMRAMAPPVAYWRHGVVPRAMLHLRQAVMRLVAPLWPFLLRGVR